MTNTLLRVGAAVLLALAALAVQARGPWRSDEGNTRGWQFMSPEERIDHQARIRGFKTFDECQAYRVEHHRLMAQRARQEGQILPGGGRDFCAHLRETRDPP